MYRYRNNSGATSRCLAALDTCLPRVGKVYEVRGYVYFGRYDIHHQGVLVKGSDGSARFSGFSWGYGGQGPKGLRTLFERLRIPAQVFKDIQTHCDTPLWSRPRLCWDLQVGETCLLRVYDTEGKIVFERNTRLAVETVPA